MLSLYAMSGMSLIIGLGVMLLASLVIVITFNMIKPTIKEMVGALSLTFILSFIISFLFASLINLGTYLGVI